MTTPNAAIELQGTVGAGVVIELAAYPGAGAVWSAPTPPPGCRIEDAGRVAADAAVGGPVTQRFRFSADSPGRYALQFELKRPWEAVVRAQQPVLIDIR